MSNVPGLERLVGEEPERDEEEDGEPGEARREQEVRSEAAVPVEEAHVPTTDCHCSA